MTLDERIEALTQSVELMARMQRDAFEESEERYLRHQERLLELAENHDRYEGKLLEFAEQHHREIVEIRRELGRAVRLSVQETRNERKRRQELAADAIKRHREFEEDSIKRHRELEDLLKAFLQRGGNGQH